MAFVLIAIIVVIVLTGLFTVKQQTAKIVERFGRFNKVANAGLNWKIPLIDRVAPELCRYHTFMTWCVRGCRVLN